MEISGNAAWPRAAGKGKMALPYSTLYKMK